MAPPITAGEQASSLKDLKADSLKHRKVLDLNTGCHCETLVDAMADLLHTLHTRAADLGLVSAIHRYR
jgi:hypothetical protein